MLISNSNEIGPMVMPYTGRDVPHILIEVNQKCNISCTACYKDKSSYSKPYKQIIEEIDLALTLRKLSLVTLAGGEPTLHPDICQVISYIVDQGLEVQILSNGLNLTDESLTKYKKAGLTQIYLHIDNYQHRPDIPFNSTEQELNNFREILGEKIRSHGIGCASAVTLYKENLKTLPDLITYILESPYHQRLLVTLCHDFSDLAHALGHDEVPEMDKDVVGNEPVTNDEVKESLWKNLKMIPYGFIASEYNIESQRWILYYSMMIKKGDKVDLLHFGPSFQRVVKLANLISMKVSNKYPFGQIMSTPTVLLMCVCYAISSLNIKEMFRVAKFMLKYFSPGAIIEQKSLCFQESPKLTETGAIDYCRGCPDATIRNGILTPVCTADFVSPIK